MTTDSPDLSHQLKSILHTMAQEYPWRPARILNDIQGFWLEVVGSSVAEHSRVIGFSRDRLLVAVRSSVWAQELTYLKPSILSALRERCHPRVTPPQDLAIRVNHKAFVSYDVISRVTSHDGGWHRVPVQETNLSILFEKVQTRHQEAVNSWLHDTHHPCRICQCPTLRGYAVCATCKETSR